MPDAIKKPPPNSESERKDPSGAIHPLPALSRARKATYLCLAFIFLAIGVVGLLLPLLPATPFLLLTSYFLARCSPRLNAILLRSRWLGPVIVDWQQNGGVRRHVRLTAIGLVLLAVGASIAVSGFAFWFSLAALLLAATGITVILCLPAART